MKQAKITCPHCKGLIIVRAKSTKDEQAVDMLAGTDLIFTTFDRLFDQVQAGFKKVFG